MSRSSVSRVRIAPSWVRHTAFPGRSGQLRGIVGRAHRAPSCSLADAELRKLGRASRRSGLVGTLFRALGRGVVRYRWVVVVIWLVGTGAAMRALPSLGSQVNNNNSAFLPASAPSNQASNLAEPLTGPANQTLVQVIAVSSNGTLSASDQSAIQSVAAALKKVPTDRQAAQVLVLSKNSPNDLPGDKTLLERMQSAVNRASPPSDLEIHFAG